MSQDPVADEYNRLRGRLCGLIESWGLPDKQERGMITTLKSLTYDSEAVIRKIVEESEDPRFITED
jgi:hypothetical protein